MDCRGLSHFGEINPLADYRAHRIREGSRVAIDLDAVQTVSELF